MSVRRILALLIVAAASLAGGGAAAGPLVVTSEAGVPRPPSGGDRVCVAAGYGDVQPPRVCVPLP